MGAGGTHLGIQTGHDGTAVSAPHSVGRAPVLTLAQTGHKPLPAMLGVGVQGFKVTEAPEPSRTAGASCLHNQDRRAL